MSRRRWFVLAVTLALLGGGGGAAYALSRGSSTAASAATVITSTVTTGTVQSTVSATGTIEPKQEEDLAFSVSGTVTSLSAEVGQKVTKGAVLATVGTTTLQSAVDTAQAAVTAAEQELSSLSGTSDTQVSAAEAQLASARTDLVNAKDDLAAASLTAPFSGTVAAVSMAVGDVVGSGSSSPSSNGASSSSDSITLISTSAWVVDASVGSADLAQLTKGMQAQITPSGATDRVFGTVSSIGIVADTSSGSTATFPVVIAVTGSPTGLYAGGSADVSFIVKQLTNVLTVPTAAVSTVNGQTVVYRQVSGKKVKTVVTLGESLGASTVVTKGLKDGDVIEITFTRPTGQRRTGTTGTSGGGTRGGFQGPPGGFTQQFGGAGQ
ncbi:MAG: HlyD family efflux transporter periplasmic adaptor subunit [Frankiales bacterium]|nr:HlyD family efflux transporter periplasmic adaptor subunit [Frankiales bacterium]